MRAPLLVENLWFAKKLDRFGTHGRGQGVSKVDERALPIQWMIPPVAVVLAEIPEWTDETLSNEKGSGVPL